MLKKSRHLVLDEADEMLSMGFQKELEEIFKQTKAKHGSIVAQKFGRVQVRVSFPKSGDTVLPKLVTVCPYIVQYTPNTGLTLFV